MLNKVILMGRLVRDPELRHTQSNIPVTSFSIAVGRRFARSADGQRPQQETDFFDIVAWDKQADFAVKWLTKGRLIAVSGRLQQRHWKDRDGNPRTSVEVVAEELHFAEPKGGAGPSEGPGTPYGGDNFAASPQPIAPTSEFAELDDDDGELPF